MSEQFISVSASARVAEPLDAARTRFSAPSAMLARVHNGRQAEIEVVHSDAQTLLYAHCDRILGVDRPEDLVLLQDDEGEIVHECVSGPHLGTTLVETFHAISADETLVTATLTRPISGRARIVRPALSWISRQRVQRRLDDRGGDLLLH